MPISQQRRGRPSEVTSLAHRPRAHERWSRDQSVAVRQCQLQDLCLGDGGAGGVTGARLLLPIVQDSQPTLRRLMSFQVGSGEWGWRGWPHPV